MKLLKKHYEYLPYLYLPILIIALVILYFFPQQILLCFRAHWLVLFFLLLIIVTPIGNIRLGNEKIVNFWQWLLLVFSAQLGISFVYYGFSEVISKSLPIFITTNSNVFASSSKILFRDWGYYPFAAFLLTGIIFSYYGFYKKTPATLSRALQPLLKNKTEDALSLSADFIVRTISLFMLASIIGIVSLQLMFILASLFQVKLNIGLNLATITIATIILLLINYPKWDQTVRYLSTKKTPLAIITILYILFIAILLVILNAIINFLATGYAPLTNPIFQFNINNWFNYWMILSAMWWIGWVPLVGGLIAFLSKGYKIRTVILGGLLSLLLISGVWILLESLTFTYLKNFSLLAAILGILMLMPLFMRAKFMLYQMRAVVPDTQPQKTRTLHFYTQALLKNAAFIVILYLPMGIYLLNVMIFALIFPLAIAIAASFLAFGLIIIRKPL